MTTLNDLTCDRGVTSATARKLLLTVGMWLLVTVHCGTVGTVTGAARPPVHTGRASSQPELSSPTHVDTRVKLEPTPNTKTSDTLTLKKETVAHIVDVKCTQQTIQ